MWRRGTCVDNKEKFNEFKKIVFRLKNSKNVRM